MRNIRLLPGKCRERNWRAASIELVWVRHGSPPMNDARDQVVCLARVFALYLFTFSIPSLQVFAFQTVPLQSSDSDSPWICLCLRFFTSKLHPLDNSVSLSISSFQEQWVATMALPYTPSAVTVRFWGGVTDGWETIASATSGGGIHHRLL